MIVSIAGLYYLYSSKNLTKGNPSSVSDLSSDDEASVNGKDIAVLPIYVAKNKYISDAIDVYGGIMNNSDTKKSVTIRVTVSKGGADKYTQLIAVNAIPADTSKSFSVDAIKDFGDQTKGVSATVDLLRVFKD